MTTHDDTPTARTETLTFDFDLPHPPEKVWRALTEPELLAEWLLPATGFALTPGTAFTLKTEPVGGWDGVVNCRLLECETLQKISYAWVVGDLDTVVTFTLTPTDSGTRLTLVHAGFRADQKQNAAGARYGWKMFSTKLADLLGRI